MPEQDPAERLDELVDAMLSGPATTGDTSAPLGDLLAVAEELRGLPSEEFRARLGAELVEAVRPSGAEMDRHPLKEVPMTTATATKTRWQMTGQGYEFCNCDFGCGCNFGGFPNSKDGSCRALVGLTITKGKCGDVDLAGVKCAAVVEWPKAIHEGNGKAAFIVDPATTDKQVEALSQIFTGQLGGLPWELLGPTFQVAGLVKAKITVEGSGRKSTFRIEGVGEGRGDTLKNPVTGEDHIVNVDLPTGFIWKKGEAGQGSVRVSAAGLNLAFEKTNWIYYNYDWSNAAA